MKTTLTIDVNDKDFNDWFSEVSKSIKDSIYCFCDLGYWTQKYSLVLFVEDGTFNDLLPNNHITFYEKTDYIELEGSIDDLVTFLLNQNNDGYIYIKWDINMQCLFKDSFLKNS